MALLQVHKENEIILNTPNRNEILKDGPPQNSKWNILGRGAYGTVFKAIFRAEKVAVKIIKNKEDVNLQTMRNEANILGWKHRNIVRVLKVESTNNFGLVIMERFVGQSLQLVLDTIELSLLHQCFIALDILYALSFCHKRDLLHLDVKPQNVLVAFDKFSQKAHNPFRRYICKLCDFGSSMKVDEQTVKSTKGVAKGTVRYMSPEALREEPLTSAADVYSLGITMWQLQQRRMPYDWIKCNEVVAYQVVKNNLRPDSVAASVERNCELNCDCKQTASETLYSIEQIRSLFTETECPNDISKAYVGSSGRKTEASLRRPFQDASSRMNANIAEVRYSRSELFLLDPIKGLSNATVSEGEEDFNLSVVLGLGNVKPKARKSRDAAYTDIYQSCWCKEFSLRPCLEELHKRLERLLCSEAFN